jgi:catechol 2,3-dioxygenase
MVREELFSCLGWECEIMIVLLINNEDVKTKQVNYNLNSSPTLGYVELKISDLDTSLRFYQEVIGFKVLTKEESRAVLTADGNTPLLRSS